MDKEFTRHLQEWLEAPAEERDLALGAKYLLQLSNNRVMYKNIMRDLQGHAQFIVFKIRRYLQYRLNDLTHEEVQGMQSKVSRIAEVHHLDKEPTASPKSEAEQWRAGKRADHEALPEVIQALYVENASILQKMRELHLQLRSLSTANKTCPDSDRYPFLKEIIALDKRYHDNWKRYDSFVVSDGKASSVAEQSLQEERRLDQKNILRQINLAKGRYKKQPSEKAKCAIVALYEQLSAPSEKITGELKRLGII